MTTVSVIIPTFNRMETLKHVLQGFSKQNYPRDDFEVVVVSDGSTDGTNEFLRSYQPSFSFVPVIQDNQGPAAARNIGIDKASKEYILFVDDDVFPTQNLIDEHMRYHKMHPNSVVIGPMLTPNDFDMLPWVDWEQSMLVKQYEAMERGDWMPTARQFYTGNASILRRFLLESGGFDASIKRAEDVELAYRLADAGMKFLFNSDAIGFHYAERSFESWLKIPYAYGGNDVKFALEKNQDWLLPAVYNEFEGRNVFIKVLCSLCLDREITTKLMITFLAKGASVGQILRRASLTRMMYSGIFNLSYYQGVADELGGRVKFYQRAYA